MSSQDIQFAYQSGNSFLNVVKNQADKPYAVVGVPYDGAVTNRPGARFGPDAIRRSSHMLCDAIHPYFDASPIETLTDLGDMILPNTALAPAREAIETLALAAMQKHHVCFIGGDHSITLSLLRAQRKLLGQPLALIHFDAHCDTWTDHFGEPSGHGTWTYEAIQEGLLIPQATMQIGIRSAGEKAAREYVNDIGGRVFTARELRGCENATQLKFLLDEVRERINQAGNPPTYLTIDIDCLDPAFAPGTGTPEPGGMSTNQVLTILEELNDLPYVGMDCVEVAPVYDHAELTSNAAATFIWTYLCGLISAKNKLTSQ
jgi:agmatinase